MRKLKCASSIIMILTAVGLLITADILFAIPIAQVGVDRGMIMNKSDDDLVLRPLV